MNYENATDTELNIRLTSLVYKLDGWECTPMGTIFFHCGVDGGQFYEQKVINYCTDWSATMPLAVEYGVTPLLDDGFGYATTDPYECYEPHGASEEGGFFAVKIDHDTPPLRAIVICLIKVLESKQ